MKIKIDLIYSGWLSAPNGVSTFLKTFKKGFSFFQKKDIELNIYSSDIYVSRDFEKNNVGLTGNIKRLIKKIISNQSFLTIMFLKKNEERTKKIVETYLNKKDKADIVFFHELTTCYHYLKKRENNYAKVVLVLHTNGDTYKMLRIYHPKLIKSSYYKYLLNVEKYVLNHVDQLGFVAEGALNNFKKIKPNYNSSKLFYVLNGLGNTTVKNKHKGKNKYSFCCVGSITKRKGQDLIIKAFEKLDKEEQDKFEFVFLGEGEEKKNLINYVKSKNLEKYFIFEGAVNNVGSYLEKSNGFILTSHDEGLPISIIEALRFGLPIISTNVGGIPEMIAHGENGFLIEPNEEELLDLFKGIDDFDLNQLGLKSKQIYMDRFTENAMFTNYIKIFNKVLT